MKRLFTFAVLLVLSCMLGNRALAQTKSASNTSFTHEVYDFREIPQTTQTTNSTNVWSSNYTFGDWGQTAMFNINNNSQFTVSEGDIIRVSFTNAGNDREGRIKPNGSYDELIDYNTFRYGNDYYEATITGTVTVNGNSVNVADYINSNGFGIQAKNMTITSVDIIPASGNEGGFTWNGNNLVSISGTTFPKADRISVSNTDGWQIWTSDENQCSYLQRASGDVRYFYINNLHVGDVVRIWCQGDCRILTDNTATHDSSNPLVWNHNDPYPNERDQAVNDRQGVQLNETLYRVNNGTQQNPNWTVIDQNPNGNELKIVNDHDNGTLVIRMASQWAGILKIEIDAVNTTPHYDYDPGFEVYDMFETRNDAGNTSYTANESAGFKLNNKDAYYLKFTNNDLTMNERVAIDKTNTWGFARGIQAPNYSLTNDSWYNLSICNLREGDRVVIYYTGDAPIFSSNGQNGGYTGNAAYKDTWNDGMLDKNEGDHEINNGDPVEYSYCRDEGNIARDEGTPHVWIYTSYPYVMMENGHLDLALRNGNRTRIVKIKIYSDHQAMMVDDYIKADYAYQSYFNITGQLQAKEHIVPGGLEVSVGNDDADQHAIVVFSKEGPVSYVNAVDGFKLPGTTKVNNVIQRDFNLADHAPETGTYYKFIPEVSGKMTVRFKATSLNYYRWDLAGNAIYYDDGGWTEEFDRANEWPMNRNCPYYLKVQDGSSYYQPSDLKVSTDGTNFSEVGQYNTLLVNNGEYRTLTLNVEAGKTYYLYGAWSGQNYQIPDPRTSNLNGYDACGVAELLWVEFKPNNSIYPLAKWVPNNTKAVKNGEGVPNPDTFALEYELADVVGYVDQPITVKKMSGNIIACHPYIDYSIDGDNNANTGKLMIDGIVFATENGKQKNPGGTILIKIGDPSVRANPLYALTIAYSTDPKYDNQQGTGKRGHSWDMSTQSLNALTWDLQANQFVTPDEHGVFHSTSTGYASVSPLGTYFTNYFGADISNYSSVEAVESALTKNTSSLLHKEINEHSDWMFNYNLLYGGKLYDPVFTNKYDMEGDNADMIWDTEGTVFKTSANQSVIFNEFGSNVTDNTTNDPDRYIGILEGGEFRIPWLMPNDRVIIWMGTGKGRYADEVKFNIRNAYDALHNPISESDDYIVGGSQWTSEGNSKYGYHGCYHFFATGHDGDPADMVFNMKEGSMCKIYKIQIYRGDRIITNEVVGETSDDKFLLWSRADDPNDPNDQAENGPASNWTLKYFGKDQKLANGQKGNTVNSSLAAQANDFAEVKGSSAVTGAGILSKGLTTSAVTDPTAATYNTFTFEHDLTTIGTFRARAKDMEKNNNYVADYAEHNVTVVLQETQKYPYTWDFTDMTGWSNNISNFQIEDAIMSSSAFTSWPEWFDSADQWNASYEKSSKDVSLWGAAVGNENGYVLRLNTQETPSDYPQDNIFESAQAIGGNQLWANGRVIPESKGLWFHTLDQSTQYGSMRVYDDGMSVAGLDGWCYNMVVPNVPKDAAVYMRIKKARDVGRVASYKFEGSDASNLTLIPVAWKDNDKSKDATEWIVAIKNSNSTKKNLTLSLAGYQLKKLAVSEDPKKIGKTGFATESRERIIDHDLTEYLTGVPVKAYQASFDKEEKPTQVILSHIRFMPAAPGITKNEQGVVTNDGLTNNEGLGCILYNDAEADSNESIGKKVDVLDGGFHLFVPDMHDNEEELTDWDDQVCDTESNILRSCVPAATSNTDRLAATAANGDTRYILSAQPYQNAGEGYQAGDGGKAGLVGFYKVDPTNGAKKTGNIAYMQLGSSQISYSKVSMLFFDELIIEGNSGIATAIETVDAARQIQDGWYNMNGQKLNGAPAAKGLYIVNGKKVLVK